MYDDENIFAKILKGNIPSKKIYEDNHVYCFEDISKAAPIHWLVIPKTKHTDYSNFVENNSQIQISSFFESVQKIIKMHGLDKKGYRLITNCGENGGQTVFHFHVHILSGKKISSNLA